VTDGAVEEFLQCERERDSAGAGIAAVDDSDRSIFLARQWRIIKGFESVHFSGGV